MYKDKKFSPLILLVLLMMVVTAFSTISVAARNNHNYKKRKPQAHRQEKPSIASAPAPYGSSSSTHSNIFNILSFGAKGDGVSDDSKAVQAAWKAACMVGWSTIVIPSKFKFLITPITLQGPCRPQLVLQIDGTLLASQDVASWPKDSLFQWLNFKWIRNFTIQGTGTVDGQGSVWWNLSQLFYIQKRAKYVPKMKPSALRFYESYNVTVRDIKIVNSPLCHLKFDNSGTVHVNNVTISSPENSPNTDGIHLQNTKDVEIQHSHIGCGDDCVSIQTGCSNVHVHHVNCGPGHGISLGSLGKDKSIGCIRDIVIEYIAMVNTLSGVRIKTWQGGLGSVKNISFSKIQVSDVKVPIVIDQYYCDKKLCKNQTQAVAISEITYNQIIGTYSAQPIYLACSNNVPCTNVDLIDIQLAPLAKSRGRALCWNSYGISRAPLVPSSIDYCLQRGGASYNIQAKSHELCW